MPDLAHGAVCNPDDLQQARVELASRSAEVELGFAATRPADVHELGGLGRLAVPAVDHHKVGPCDALLSSELKPSRDHGSFARQ